MQFIETVGDALAPVADMMATFEARGFEVVFMLEPEAGFENYKNWLMHLVQEKLCEIWLLNGKLIDAIESQQQSNYYLRTFCDGRDHALASQLSLMCTTTPQYDRCLFRGSNHKALLEQALGKCQVQFTSLLLDDDSQDVFENTTDCLKDVAKLKILRELLSTLLTQDLDRAAYKSILKSTARISDGILLEWALETNNSCHTFQDLVDAAKASFAPLLGTHAP